MRSLPRAAGVVALLVGVAPLAAGAASSAAATGGTASASSVVTAHLQLKVLTSSDWTSIHLHPGQIVAARVTSASGAGTWSATPDGLGYSGGIPGAQASAVEDLVLYEPTGASTFTLTIDKGLLGKTTVALANRNGAAPTSPTVFSDTVHSLGDPNNAASATVPRSVVMTGTPLIYPRADRRHLVLAFYYPWFTTYRQPALFDTPRDPRSTGSLVGVESMTAQAKAHGISGFVVSWDGQAARGEQFAVAEQAAAEQGQVITGYLESTKAKANGGAATELAWLHQLLTYAGSGPGSGAFLTAADGTPVVFVYQMGAFTPRQWAWILGSLARQYGEHVDLVGDALNQGYLRYEWGVHRYDLFGGRRQLSRWSAAAGAVAKAPAVVDPSVAPRLFAGTAWPGFDDRKLRGLTHPLVPRHGSRTLARTWKAAQAGQPDWMLVTSWNEWFEGTEVEPGTHTGGRALRKLSRLAAAFRTTR